MKIYFTASVAGKNFYKQNYQKIFEYFLTYGQSVNNNHFLEVTKQDIANETDEEARTYYKKMLNWIKTTDLLIAEVSSPSFGVGHEISLALNEGKPVLALHVMGKNPYLLESINDEKLLLMEYNFDNLKELIKEGVVFAQTQMDTRFTMILSPKIKKHLDNISKAGVSRSKYIRNLIQKDIEKKKL